MEKSWSFQPSINMDQESCFQSLVEIVEWRFGRPIADPWVEQIAMLNLVCIIFMQAKSFNEI